MSKDWQQLLWSGSLAVMGLMEQLSLLSTTRTEWPGSMSWRGLEPWWTWSGEASLLTRYYAPRVLEETPACRRSEEEEKTG